MANQFKRKGLFRKALRRRRKGGRNLNKKGPFWPIYWVTKDLRKIGANKGSFWPLPFQFNTGARGEAF